MNAPKKRKGRLAAADSQIESTANQKRAAWTTAFWAKLRANPKLYRAHCKKRLEGTKAGFLRQRLLGNFGPAFRRRFLKEGE